MKQDGTLFTLENDELLVTVARRGAEPVSYTHLDVYKRQEEELTEEYVIPAAFDERVGKAVAEAVAKAARKSGVAGK